jgi:hypothetical protein
MSAFRGKADIVSDLENHKNFAREFFTNFFTDFFTNKISNLMKLLLVFAGVPCASQSALVEPVQRPCSPTPCVAMFAECRIQPQSSEPPSWAQVHLRFAPSQ